MELQTLGEIVKYAAAGVVGAVMWWDKVYKPAQEKKVIEAKKAAGTYVTWESMDTRINTQGSELAELKNKVDRNTDHIKYQGDKLSGHLEKEHMEDQEFAVIKTRQANLEATFEKTITRIEKNVGEIWNAVDTIKTHLMGK